MSGERRDELLEELERKRRLFHEALSFLSADQNLTDRGKAQREVLLRELAEIERDVDAIRQEHRLD